MYLNKINFGQQSYGVKVAAKTYFDKELSDFVSKESLRKAIHKERRLELALECDRWFDIVRTNIFNEVFVGVDSYRVLYPIPQTEIEVSGGLLIQNSGY